MHILRGTARALAGGGAVAEAADPLLTGLLAWYRADGTDRSGNANDLTAAGTPGTAAGVGAVAGSAMSLSELNYFTRDDLVTSGAMTLAAWLYGDTAGEFMLVGQRAAVVTASTAVALAVTDAFEVYGTDGGGDLAPQSSAITGVWSHIVIATTGAVTKLYQDGAEIATVTRSPVYTDVTTFSVGEPYDVVIPTVLLCEAVGVWSRALSAGEVTTLYGAGSGNPAYDPTA
jgi:hypothetical protein